MDAAAVHAYEQNPYAPYDTAGDITKKVRLNVPDFDGRFNVTTLSTGYLQLKNTLTGMTCLMSDE